MELEIILPRDMTVQESHDLSLELQHKVSLVNPRKKMLRVLTLRESHCLLVRQLSRSESQVLSHFDVSR